MNAGPDLVEMFCTWNKTFQYYFNLVNWILKINWIFFRNIVMSFWDYKQIDCQVLKYKT